MRPIIVGSGIAGLSTALALDGCVVVTAGGLGATGSSPLAQGGIAAAIGTNDSPAAHAEDTIAVAGGIADRAVVELLAGAAPGAIRALESLGARFDATLDGTPSLGREAGHSARRIVHADGDATGAAVMATLTAAVRDRADIDVLEHTTVVDLILAGQPGPERVAGVLVEDGDGGRRSLLTDAVVLATGGYGHCFAKATAPAGAIGTAVALAGRAGAAVADLEFVQFHPTALDVAGPANLPLLTEALRGEGATLVDRHGHRFLLGAHPEAELAPRDVVARATYRELIAGNRPYLDARVALGDDPVSRFPTVTALTVAAGFDPAADLLPVTPAAHYCMGGVAVDRRGRSTLPGLWAVGEAAATGVHGANRLASNSLLEGLAFGPIVAADVDLAPAAARAPSGAAALWLPADLETLDRQEGGRGPELTGELRGILWRAAGVVRDEAGLCAGRAAIARLDADTRHDRRARTVATVGAWLIEAALARTESRGGHFRADHPMLDPAQGSRSRSVPGRAPHVPWSEVGGGELVQLGQPRRLLVG